VQPAYRRLADVGQLPVAEKGAREILSLPLYPQLPPESVERVAAAIEEFERQ
jgi:dTDP-4-amino-4,6-dideoxygalactose transaminase